MAHTTQLYSLLASLPALSMQEKPALTSAAFLEAAEAFVQGKDLEDLRALSLIPAENASFSKGSFAADYTAWEMALRSAILRLRTAKRKEALPESGRHELSFECDAESAAQRAYAAADPLEREKILDQARWTKTEELTVRSIYDLNSLGAYRIRLQIAEKWAARKAGDPAANMDAAAERLTGGTAQTENQETSTY